MYRPYECDTGSICFQNHFQSMTTECTASVDLELQMFCGPMSSVTISHLYGITDMALFCV